MAESIKNICTNGTDNDLKALLKRYQELNAVRGVIFEPFSSYSLNLLKTLPNEAKKQIASHLSKVISVMEVIPLRIPRNSFEQRCLHGILEPFKWSLSDDFYSNIVDGDIVEVFNIPAKNQVYHNAEFLVYSSYDLLTVMMHSVFELYDRKDQDEQLLGQRIEEISKTNTLQFWQLPDCELVEKLHHHRNRFKISMKYAETILDEQGHPVALALQAESAG